MRSGTPRVQAVACRGNRVLMVRHQQGHQTWWCLPGGGMEDGETPAEGALRELREECNVQGALVRQTAHVTYAPDDETYSFLVDIGDQKPSLGYDPGVGRGKEILVDVRWLSLSEIPERDRVFLWASGLLGVGDFLREVESWGDRVSYP